MNCKNDKETQERHHCVFILNSLSPNPTTANELFESDHFVGLAAKKLTEYIRLCFIIKMEWEI